MMMCVHAVGFQGDHGHRRFLRQSEHHLPTQQKADAKPVKLRTLLKQDLAEFLRLKAIVEKHKKKWLEYPQLVS